MKNEGEVSHQNEEHTSHITTTNIITFRRRLRAGQTPQRSPFLASLVQVSSYVESNHVLYLAPSPEITGAFTEHKVRHRKTSGAEATKKKKADNKKKRQEKQQEKVAALALHNGIDEEDEEGEEGEEDAQPAVREVDGEVDGEVEVHLQFVRVADNSEAESDGDMSEDEGSGDEEEEGQVLSFVVHNLQVPLGVDLVSSEFTETGESQPVYIGEIDDQDENASVRKHNEAARLQGGMEIAKGDRIVAIDGASITGNVGDWAVDAAIAMLIELQKNGRAFSITVEREHKAEQDEDHETDDSERK